MTEIRPAATVLALRERDGALEVLMVQRSARSTFMPSVWVFPGGRVEGGDEPASDADIEALAAWPSTDLSPAQRYAMVAAAIRETWEEAHVWLGGPSRTSLDGCHLRPWARWVTPEGESRRYDTIFFIAQTPALTAPRPDEAEVVNVGWFRPAAVLAAGMATMPLAPPTWWALRELEALGTQRKVWDAAVMRDLRPICPRRLHDEAGVALALPGDLSHDEAARDGLPHRISWRGEGWAL